MRRPLLRLLCPVLLVVALPAQAAELTQVADAADPDDPFDLEVEVGWHRVQQNATILRESLEVDPTSGETRPREAPELRYKSVESTLLLTARAGLYRNLELHLTLPIVLSHAQTWRPSARAAGTVDNAEGFCASGEVDPSCATPLLDASGPDNNSYRAGLGDGTLGLAWGILDDERDPHSPSWVVGVDWTFPSGEKRSGYVVSHDPDDPAAVGLKSNFFTFYTALSKRTGAFDPFVKFWYRLPRATSRAFSNCEDPSRLADMDASTDGVQNTCTVGREWFPDGEGNDPGGFSPSHSAGFDLGTELVPYVDPENFVQVSVLGSVGAAYVSEGRGFSELSDALQRLTYTEDHLRFEGRLGLRMQASRFAKLHLLGTAGYDTGHLLTNEVIGRDLDGTGLVEIPPDRVNPERNPNYDFRWDQAGRRFRIEDVVRFGFLVVGEVDF